MRGEGIQVFWDSYGILRGPGGIHVHARELRKNLAAIGCEVQVTRADSRHGFFGKIVDLSKVLAPHENFKVALAASGGRFLYHGLSNINLPVFHDGDGSRQRARFVLTVHDLIPLLASRGDVSLASRAQFGFLLPRALKLADAIVVVSRWTRDTVLERFPFAAGKIVLIPNGFPELLSVEPRPQGQDSDSLPRLLTVGRSEPYKRHGLFLELIRLAAGTVRGVLVTAGLAPAERELAAGLVAAGLLDLVVNPPEEVLFRLYRSSDLYLQTSLLEGFCLPAAEAQASGIPVIFTVGSGIDEIIDPAGGRGLAASAGAGEWLDAVQEAILELPERRQATAAWAASMPRWADAAKSLKNLYNSF